MVDNVNHPAHYTSDKSGVECIEITRHRNFNIGNAIKYLWRAGIKDADVSAKHIEDLQKAIFYLTREIENIKNDLADAEDERTEDYTADWVRALFGPDYIAAAKEAHPAGKGIRVEDCQVVEDYDDDDLLHEDGAPCDCEEERPTPTYKVWVFNGKDFVETNAFSSIKFSRDEEKEEETHPGFRFSFLNYKNPIDWCDN